MRGYSYSYSSRHQASLFTTGFYPITPHTSRTSTTTSLYSKYFQSHIRSPKRNISNMASATSVFDFKPLNSRSHPSHVLFAPATIPIPLPYRDDNISLSFLCYTLPLPPRVLMLTPHREGRARTPLRLRRESPPHRQHRLQVRLHPPIRRPRGALQEDRSLPSRPVCCPRLPLQPIRWSGARSRR